MKTLGIVRRIDELGRIVIPKEIRKKLNIHFGESLEIFMGEDNNLIIRKKKTLKEIKLFINDLLTKISLKLNKTIMVCDYDEVLCTTNKQLNDFFSSSWLDIRQSKGIILADEEYYYLCKPIIVNSDKLGMIFLLSKKETFMDIDDSYLELLGLFIENYVEQ